MIALCVSHSHTHSLSPFLYPNPHIIPVKAPIDVACHDILGKKHNLPICVLLGGRYEDSYALYRAISQDTPARMAESVRKYKSEGYTKFQLKVGSTPDEDIGRIKAVAAELDRSNILMADANTGCTFVCEPPTTTSKWKKK